MEDKTSANDGNSDRSKYAAPQLAPVKGSDPFLANASPFCAEQSCGDDDNVGRGCTLQLLVMNIGG